MDCPSCSESIDADSKFCSFCGSLFSEGEIKNPLTIGRDPENDIILNFPQVSSKHALLIKEKNGWVLEDMQSTNHTYINDRSIPVFRQQITSEDTIFFGSYKVSASRLLSFSQNTALGRSDPKKISIPEGEIIFGRDPDCSVPLNFPQISWHHAQLTRDPNSSVLKDLGSTNGTYVNGKRIKQCKVTQDDTIAFGSFEFKLTEDHRIVKRNFQGDIRIDADNITVQVWDKKESKSKTLLDNISLSIYPSEFVGLMGPSGAGKTTLMLALNGYLKPTKGDSRINDHSLFRNYDSFRSYIGYIPQDDIIHPELTVFEALNYTARLRLPSDTSKKEISALIDKVLSQLGLVDFDQGIDVKNVLIGSSESKGISGGQRKRVNLAMELLTEPSLLFLDEPTSGLSSEDTLVVMNLLRHLANNGKTIILTIHQPSLEAYKKLDNVIILSKGKLAYYGPAHPDAINFFNPDGSLKNNPSESSNLNEEESVCPSCKHGWSDLTLNPDNALRGLAKGEEKKIDWESRYKKDSPHYKAYIQDRRKNTSDSVPRNDSNNASYPFNFRQWVILTQRFLTIKRKDFLNTTILFLQAPIIALIVALVFFEQKGDLSATPAIPLFFLVISAVWFGASNAAREIVAEKAIYLRERMVNLKIPSYVFSKYTVLGVLCFFQCLVFVAIIHPILDLNGDFIKILGSAFLASLSGLSIGLFISSISKTQQAAISLIPIVLLPMVILGGGIVKINKMDKATYLLANFTPTRWAYEQVIYLENKGMQERHRAGDSEDNPQGNLNYVEQMYGERKKGSRVVSTVMMGFTLGFLGLTMIVLKKKDIV